MAIGADFSVATNGDIRHVSGTETYSVLELHRWLQSLADDENSTGNDYVDIVTDNPSERSTDQIITLLDYSGSGGPTFNIDDTAAEFFFGGSVLQRGGDELYSGLQVLGSVNDTATQLMIIQDNDLYQFTTTPASPFWGTQATGGYNGNAAAGILMQILVKSRVNGADINGKRIRVQARHMDAGGGDTFAFFNTTLGEGVAVAALTTVNDVQNDTAVATISAYTDVLNSGGTANAPTGGYQTIDLNNGNGAQPYYSQWTYGTNPDGLKAIWEYSKELSYEASTKTIDGLTGYLFLGVTHDFNYDGLSGTFNERELLVWGTKVFYDTLVSGPFTEGNYVTIGSNGAAGRVLYDDGVDELIIALEDTSITLLDNDVITEYDIETGATGTTAAINTGGGAITDNDKSGGTGWILADDTTDTLWIQLLTGSAPVDNLPLRGVTSGATALVNGSATSRTVSNVYTGSYTGSYIGAFGVGFDPDDVTSNELLTDLLNANQQPPNNVTFTVSGLVASEDRVLVGPRSGSALQTNQDTINGTLSGAAVGSITMTTAIPSDTPSTGTIRVQNDVGRFVRCAYTSYTGSVYTISPTVDFSGENATTGNDAFIGYIDKTAGAASESFTSIFNATRDLFVRVRDGGATPIKQFESTTAQLTATGGSVGVIRTTDA